MPPAAAIDLSALRNTAVGDNVFHMSTGVNQSSELQEPPQADELSADRDVDYTGLVRHSGMPTDQVPPASGMLTGTLGRVAFLKAARTKAAVPSNKLKFGRSETSEPSSSAVQMLTNGEILGEGYRRCVGVTGLRLSSRSREQVCSQDVIRLEVRSAV